MRTLANAQGMWSYNLYATLCRLWALNLFCLLGTEFEDELNLEELEEYDVVFGDEDEDEENEDIDNLGDIEDEEDQIDELDEED